MVSTRGVRPKFDVGERVLCYEPDPKKIKMIYDAKILSAAPTTDEKGRRIHEYFIHFQGWNTSWDRYVADDLLLKDSDDNRKEQRRLYELTEEYKIRTERKRKRKLAEKIRASMDSNSSLTDQLEETRSKQTKEGENLSASEDSVDFGRRCFYRSESNGGSDLEESKDEKSGSAVGFREAPGLPIGEEDLNESGEENPEDAEDICTGVLPLPLPDSLKLRLEDDMRRVKGGKLVQLPMKPNVTDILEAFVIHYAMSRLVALEKQNQKIYNQYRQQDRPEAEKYEEVLQAIKIAKEVAEGIRILFDFHLGNILLYEEEYSQYRSSNKFKPHTEGFQQLAKTLSPATPSPATPTSRKVGKGSGKAKDATATKDTPPSAATNSGRKRNLRQVSSQKKDQGDTDSISTPMNTSNLLTPTVSAISQGGSGCDASSGTATPTTGIQSATWLSVYGATTCGLVSQNTQFPQSKKSHQILRELSNWKLVPDSIYFEPEVPVSLVYGGVHLARLLVKLPEIFAKTRFKTTKVKFIMKYVECIVDFVNTLPDLFSEAHYA